MSGDVRMFDLWPRFLTQSPWIPRDFLGNRSIFCFNEVTLVGAGHQHGQAMIRSLERSALETGEGRGLETELIVRHACVRRSSRWDGACIHVQGGRHIQPHGTEASGCHSTCLWLVGHSKGSNLSGAPQCAAKPDAVGVTWGPTACPGV
jgi:hypothetical protein